MTNRVNAARLNVIAKALYIKVEVFFQKDQAPVVSSLINVTDKGAIRMLQTYDRINDHATEL